MNHLYEKNRQKKESRVVAPELFRQNSQNSDRDGFRSARMTQAGADNFFVPLACASGTKPKTPRGGVFFCVMAISSDALLGPGPSESGSAAAETAGWPSPTNSPGCGARGGGGSSAAGCCSSSTGALRGSAAMMMAARCSGSLAAACCSGSNGVGSSCLPPGACCSCWISSLARCSGSSVAAMATRCSSSAPGSPVAVTAARCSGSSCSPPSLAAAATPMAARHSGRCPIGPYGCSSSGPGSLTARCSGFPVDSSAAATAASRA